MQEKTYIHKKRIVFTALSPYFSDQSLMKALVLWEKKYSNAPSFRVQHFVFALKTIINEDADFRAVHLNLVKASSIPESKLLADPTDLVEEFKELHGIMTDADFSLPELDALIELLTKWLYEIPGPDADQVKQFVIDNLSKQKLDQSLTMHFISWLNNHQDEIRLPAVDMKDLRKIVNLFYTAYCELLGPISTDKSLNTAVNKIRAEGAPKLSQLITQLL